MSSGRVEVFSARNLLERFTVTLVIASAVGSIAEVSMVCQSGPPGGHSKCISLQCKPYMHALTTSRAAASFTETVLTGLVLLWADSDKSCPNELSPLQELMHCSADGFVFDFAILARVQAGPGTSYKVRGCATQYWGEKVVYVHLTKLLRWLCTTAVHDKPVMCSMCYFRCAKQLCVVLRPLEICVCCLASTGPF